MARLLFSWLERVERPNHILLLLVKLAIENLQIPPLKHPLNIKLIVAVLMQDLLVLNILPLLEILRHLAHVQIENLVELLGLRPLVEMEEQLEEVELADLVVAIGVEDVEGDLEEQGALVHQLEHCLLVLFDCQCLCEFDC